jgi:hypothetical protein
MLLGARSPRLSIEPTKRWGGGCRYASGAGRLLRAQRENACCGCCRGQRRELEHALVTRLAGEVAEDLHMPELLTGSRASGHGDACRLDERPRQPRFIRPTAAYIARRPSHSWR